MTPVTVALRYHYDDQGRVVGRTLNPGTPEEESLFYLYDGARIAEQVDGDGGLVACWDYGLYVDEAVRMDRGGQSYYFHQDDLYNVVAVSDINGALAERYEYGDYGLPEIYDPNGVPLDASAVGNPFLFTGRRWHPELQLYHYRTRFMDPVMGRFVSRDTIGLYGDPANLGNPNAYVGNNPWSRLDPWGASSVHVEEELIRKIQKVAEDVLALAPPTSSGALNAGRWYHQEFQKRLDALGDSRILTETVIDSSGLFSRRGIGGVKIPDVIILKAGQDAAKIKRRGLSLQGRVNAAIDLKTGKARIETKWAGETLRALGIRSSDIHEMRRGTNLVASFAEVTKFHRALRKRLAKYGFSVAASVGVADVFWSYHDAKRRGWPEDECRLYALMSTVDADILYDAAELADEQFWETANQFANNEITLEYIRQIDDGAHGEFRSDGASPFDIMDETDVWLDDPGGATNSRRLPWSPEE